VANLNDIYNMIKTLPKEEEDEEEEDLESM
jgi:hypothetical protein